MNIFPLESAAIIAWGMPSFQELFIILVIVLIVFGAKRLPELARALGQSMNEFRKAKDEFEKEFHKSAQPSSSSPAATQQPSLPSSGAPVTAVLVPQPPLQTVPVNHPPSSQQENRAI